MRNVVAAVALFIVLAACGDATAPPPSMTGAWTGTAQGNTFSLTLSETGGNISGSGNVMGLNVAVFGTYDHPAVLMTWTASGYAPAYFKGTRNGSTVTGVINASGFQNSPLTLSKQ